MKFTKIEAGHYATEDGRYAVVSDGYSPGYIRDEYGDVMGVGGEWAAVYDPHGGLRTDHNAGENLNWFPTKREAVAYLERNAS